MKYAWWLGQLEPSTLHTMTITIKSVITHVLYTNSIKHAHTHTKPTVCCTCACVCVCVFVYVRTYLHVLYVCVCYVHVCVSESFELNEEFCYTYVYGFFAIFIKCNEPFYPFYVCHLSQSEKLIYVHMYTQKVSLLKYVTIIISITIIMP